ncbi:MAG: STT3 domain-containing protein [Candidatus Aenigmatarchaeota archaeon]
MDRAVSERAAVILLLAFIVLFGFYVRSVNNVPDRMLSYDPVFQYRFTKYFADFGELPLWDELSYYTGRAVSTTAPGLMFYLTTLVYSFTKNLGWSLVTTATFASAWYGAFIAVPAFLLGRELSNKWGGLLAAALTTSAPQILVRTFGASYDTDQIAIFFILMTLWAGLCALKKRDLFSISLASAFFIAFAAAWQMFWYTFFFLVAAVAVYSIVCFASLYKGKSHGIAKTVFGDAKPFAAVVASIFFIVFVGTTIIGMDTATYFFAVIGFAQEAEKQIVNISIAELQLINLADTSTWMMAVGRFLTGDAVIDNLFFLTLVSLMLYGLRHTYKSDKLTFSFLLTILAVSFYTITRGIRFTEFSAGLLLAVAAAGFGLLVADVKGKDVFVRASVTGLGIFLAAFAVFMGLYVGQNLGPDTNQNWESAWAFLRTQTPELSLVGTWWDPGHMIAGQAERRVIADGAHCGYQCLYGINDRITNLGKIMATDNEELSVELIKKYRGTSPKVYWIASDDLISKYQWLQYFGLGCDSRTDSRCQLYTPIGLQSFRYDQTGKPIVKVYGPIIVLDVAESPTAIYVQGKNAAFLDEVLYYRGDRVETVKAVGVDRTALARDLDPLVQQLGYRMSNQTVPITAWVAKDSSMIVVIPPNLRNTVFTRMFFLEGRGLEHFKQVFRNEQVKIYEVEF